MYEDDDGEVYWVPVAPRKRNNQRQQGRRRSRRSCDEVIVFAFMLLCLGAYLRFG